MENSMERPQKIKNRNTIWSRNFTGGYLSKVNKSPNWKRYIHPYVHCHAIYNSQAMEESEVSTDWWMDQEDGAYTYNERLLSHSKKWILAIADNMDGSRGYYTKWNKLEKAILNDLTYM